MNKQIHFISLLLGLFIGTASAQTSLLNLPPIATGPFKPDWHSLTNYQAPEWFRDAKFGIWAHWGSQCQPEHGDWYARSMYETGSPNYRSHIRVTQSKDGKTLYALVLEIPKDGQVRVKSLGSQSQYWPGKIGSVRLVGGAKLKFTRDAAGLQVVLPEKFEGRTALALEIRS
jgi:hypothetical protein